MDADRFDALSRALTTAHTRRRLSRLLGGLSLGGVLSTLASENAAAALLLGGARCSSKTQCKSGRCLNPDRCDCTRKSCTCSCACSRIDPTVRCLTPANRCKKAVCSAAGRCVTRNKADGTDCDVDKQCSSGVCDTPPICQNGGCIDNFNCCSGICQCPRNEFNMCTNTGACTPSFTGSPCSRDGDCATNNCVGFVCKYAEPGFGGSLSLVALIRGCTSR